MLALMLGAALAAAGRSGDPGCLVTSKIQLAQLKWRA
jgi:hypothetical protein